MVEPPITSSSAVQTLLLQFSSCGPVLPGDLESRISVLSTFIIDQVKTGFFGLCMQNQAASITPTRKAVFLCKSVTGSGLET